MNIVKIVLILLALMAPVVAHGNPTRISPPHLKRGDTAKISYNAPANAAEVYIHYGFNGWNLPLSHPDAGTENTGGNLNHFIHSKMAWDSTSGSFQSEIEIPQSARALHYVFCWDECSQDQWDNNNNLDYARSLIFPYIGPYLTWDETTPPDSGIVISSELDQESELEVQYWSKAWYKRTMKSPKSRNHHIRINGLTPDTTYYYQVKSGSRSSKTYSFRTMKESSHINSLSFLVFGDSQDNGETGIFPKTALDMVRYNPGADFIISTGDLVWNDRPGHWWYFFDAARELFARKVIMPIVGNHDTPGNSSSADSTNFARYFQLPNFSLEKTHFTFEVGPAKFFGLNSDRHSDWKKGSGTQYRWMQTQTELRKRQLQSSDVPLWTFAYWHIPPYNAGGRHAGQSFLSRPLVNNFFPGVVDWTFNGHEHLYQRMKPLSVDRGTVTIASKYGTEIDAGVGYLVTPPAGIQQNPSFISDPDALDRLGFPTSNLRHRSYNGYTRVDISGKRLTLRTYVTKDRSSNGKFELLDSVQYEK
jgi:hypothetical protein